MKNQSKRWAGFALAATMAGFAGVSHAGPFILDLTDADDHGSASGGANIDGWFYMQRVLENLAPGVTNGNMNVVNLGSTNTTSSSDAYDASASAFNLSSLPGSGWSWTNIDGATAMTDFFNGTGAVNINNTGIIVIDSGSNVGGGITSAELAVLNSFATSIDSFLGGGGALHSQAEAGSGQYGWLATLLPGLTFTTSGGSGLFLTPPGSAAFPGLSNSDLSAGPFHGAWTSGLGGLTVLFDDVNGDGGRPVGIGSEGGSVTDPGGSTVPEPGVLALLGGSLIAFGIGRAKRRS